MFAYPFKLTPDKKDGGYVVTFPDIPEAITQGETKEEALFASIPTLCRRHPPRRLRKWRLRVPWRRSKAQGMGSVIHLPLDLGL